MSDFYNSYEAPNLLDTTMGGVTGAQNSYTNQINTNIAGSNSTFGAGGGFDRGVGMLSKGVGAATSLGQLYVGLKSLGLAEDELDIKKDQWKMSKEELQHMQATRARLTASYMGNSKSQGQPQSRPTPQGSAMAGRY